MDSRHSRATITARVYHRSPDNAAETVNDLPVTVQPQLCRSAACAGRAANLGQAGVGTTANWTVGGTMLIIPANPVGR